MAKQQKRSGAFDGNDYRAGALERLDDAFVLLRAGQFSGSASDAGRAVEGMLRAVIWKRDADVRAGKKSLDTGHDPTKLLVATALRFELSAAFAAPVSGEDNTIFPA